MSSKQNDSNKINLGNYEEFFILYMDNELTPEQMNMVDDFLLANPDLRGEFEALMSVKLPAEEFTINKQELFAESMLSSSINEDLLLYIDNELDPDKERVVEFELTSNKDYQLQHEILLKAKLDPSQKIAYPNKEELYRRTERVVAFKVWMRVAAAVIIIAALSMFYFTRSNDAVNGANDFAKVKPKPAQKENRNLKQPEISKAVTESIAVSNSAEKSSQKNPNSRDREIDNGTKKEVKDPNVVINPDYIAKTDVPDEIEIPIRTNDPSEATPLKPGLTGTTGTNKEILNNPDVTSAVASAYNPVVDSPDYGPEDNKKGSVKGFLRKATRLIEKKTGFDPANDNGQLLIGAVAVNLK
jgi:hypothetical protein